MFPPFPNGCTQSRVSCWTRLSTPILTLSLRRAESLRQTHRNTLDRPLGLPPCPQGWLVSEEGVERCAQRREETTRTLFLGHFTLNLLTRHVAVARPPISCECLECTSALSSDGEVCVWAHEIFGDCFGGTSVHIRPVTEPTHLPGHSLNLFLPLQPC